MWYFIIGIIFALAECLSIRREWGKLSDADKAYMKLLKNIDGDNWFMYLVVVISRTLGWPVYLVARFMK